MKKSSVFVWLVSAMAAASFALGCTATVTAGERDDDDNSSSSSSSGSSGASSSGSSGNTSSSGGTSSSSGDSNSASVTISSSSISGTALVVGTEVNLEVTLAFDSTSDLKERGIMVGLESYPDGLTQEQFDGMFGDGGAVEVTGSMQSGTIKLPVSITAPLAGEYGLLIELENEQGAKGQTQVFKLTATAR